MTVIRQDDDATVVNTSDATVVDTDGNSSTTVVETSREDVDNPVSTDNEQDSGESGMGGTTADLESDDDTLVAANEVGLYTDVDDEHPKPLNIADEINKAEHNR